MSEIAEFPAVDENSLDLISWTCIHLTLPFLLASCVTLTASFRLVIFFFLIEKSISFVHFLAHA